MACLNKVASAFHSGGEELALDTNTTCWTTPNKSPGALDCRSPLETYRGGIRAPTAPTAVHWWWRRCVGSIVVVLLVAVVIIIVQICNTKPQCPTSRFFKHWSALMEHKWCQHLIRMDRYSFLIAPPLRITKLWFASTDKDDTWRSFLRTPPINSINLRCKCFWNNEHWSWPFHRRLWLVISSPQTMFDCDKTMINSKIQYKVTFFSHCDLATGEQIATQLFCTTPTLMMHYHTKSYMQKVMQCRRYIPHNAQMETVIPAYWLQFVFKLTMGRW